MEARMVKMMKGRMVMEVRMVMGVRMVLVMEPIVGCLCPPDVPVLVSGDGEGQGGVGEHGVDGADGLAGYRVGRRVQARHHRLRVRVVDDAGGRAVGDHQVPGLQ